MGAVTIIVDDAESILLQQRYHPHGAWGLPGGLMELGEVIEDTARREVYEETGLTIEELDFVGILSDQDNFVELPNGDQFCAVTVAYTTRVFKGSLNFNDSESLDYRFVDLSGFQGQIVKSHRRIIDMYWDKFRARAC